MLEIELTFLAKYLPEDLKDYSNKEIIDLYIPEDADHPCLRIRKKGNTFTITKKQPVDTSDVSQQTEDTVEITEEEFNVLNTVNGGRLRKHRYYFDYKNKTAEIDVFRDELEGLVLVEFEFDSVIEKDNFIYPDFILAEITQEEFIAGGKLAGKSYAEIESHLHRFSYNPLTHTE